MTQVGQANDGGIAMRHVLRTVVLAVAFDWCLLGLGAGGAQAATMTIDFETLTGPSVFGSADPPLTLGVATFAGGEILTAVSGPLVDQTTVYGTARFCSGCLSVIMITFSAPVSNFSTDVYNGNSAIVSYTVADNVGGTETKSLAAWFNSGQDTFSLPGPGITVVTIIRSTPATNWNFFIDNVRFDIDLPFPTDVNQCKHGGWESFGIFKNQGDCVSYVATHGKNPPDG